MEILTDLPSWRESTITSLDALGEDSEFITLEVDKSRLY